MIRLVRFTENELTKALTGAAKDVLASQRKDVRKGKVDIETAWAGLSPMERFQMLDGLGTEILPTLVALPDVEVAYGERATYTDREVRDTVTALLGEDVGRMRKAVLVTTRTTLVQSALSHVPPRSDPDTLTVPDHL